MNRAFTNLLSAHVDRTALFYEKFPGCAGIKIQTGS